MILTFTLFYRELISFCLDHLISLQSILSAMDSSLGLQNTVQCVCYITNEESLSTVRSIWENAVQENDGAY